MSLSGALTSSLGNLYVTNAAEQDDIPSNVRPETPRKASSHNSPAVVESDEAGLAGAGGTIVSAEWEEKGAATLVRQENDPASGQVKTKVVKKGVRDFTFGRTLGEGSYSTVVAATDRQTLKEYAIKVLDKRHIIKEKKVKYVNIEKNTLNRLGDHPGIVRLYYTFQDERSLYFVLDLAVNGELLGFVKKLGSFDEECTRFYAAQILDSIEYMHSRGVIHRDMKPENVLLDDRMRVKITDFGTAKILDKNREEEKKDSRANSFVGTAEYVSPELLTDKAACKSSDLWALGCIIYQLLAGRPPFKASNEYQTFQKIVALDYSFPTGFPPVARDLVSKLLVIDPQQRLRVEAIKKHPFFESIEWGRPLWKRKAPRLTPYRPNLHDKMIRLGSGPSQTSLHNTPQLPASHSYRSMPNGVADVPPPTQLDIEWSQLLTLPNERILKVGTLGTLITYTSHNNPTDQHSKLSRFFNAHKKKQRLVAATTAGRLIIASVGSGEVDAKRQKDEIVLASNAVNIRRSAKECTFIVETIQRTFLFEDASSDIPSWIQNLERSREMGIYARSPGIDDYSDSKDIGAWSPKSQTSSPKDAHHAGNGTLADGAEVHKEKRGKRQSKPGFGSMF